MPEKTVSGGAKVSERDIAKKNAEEIIAMKIPVDEKVALLKFRLASALEQGKITRAKTYAFYTADQIVNDEAIWDSRKGRKLYLLSLQTIADGIKSMREFDIGETPEDRSKIAKGLLAQVKGAVAWNRKISDKRKLTMLKLLSQYEKEFAEAAAEGQERIGGMRIGELSRHPWVKEAARYAGLSEEKAAKQIISNKERLAASVKNMMIDRGEDAWAEQVHFKGPKIGVGGAQLAKICAMALIYEKGFGVDAELTLNIVNQESQCDYSETGVAGVGLMQLTSSSVVQFDYSARRKLTAALGRVDPEWTCEYIKMKNGKREYFGRVPLVRKGENSMRDDVREAILHPPRNMLLGTLHLVYLGAHPGMSDDEKRRIVRNYNGNKKTILVKGEEKQIRNFYADVVIGRWKLPWPLSSFSEFFDLKEAAEKIAPNMAFAKTVKKAIEEKEKDIAGLR